MQQFKNKHMLAVVYNHFCLYFYLFVSLTVKSYSLGLFEFVQI